MKTAINRDCMHYTIQNGKTKHSQCISWWYTILKVKQTLPREWHYSLIIILLREMAIQRTCFEDVTAMWTDWLSMMIPMLVKEREIQQPLEGCNGKRWNWDYSIPIKWNSMNRADRNNRVVGPLPFESILILCRHCVPKVGLGFSWENSIG